MPTNHRDVIVKLTANDGTSFELRIERYEFPDEDLGPNEDNPLDEFDPGRFLIVTILVKQGDRAWQATQPEMTTTELERLASWFDSIVALHVERHGVYFTERDLEFSVDADLIILHVQLFRDFLPPWVGDRSTTSFSLDLMIHEIDLVAASQAIRAALVTFPSRPNPSLATKKESALGDS